MKLSRRFEIFALTSTLIAGVAIASTVFLWKFNEVKQDWETTIKVLSVSNPTLLLHTHFHNTGGVERELSLAINHSLLTHSLSVDRISGDAVGVTGQPLVPERPIDRTPAQMLETLNVSFFASIDVEQTSRWQDRFNPVFYLSVPLLTPVDPNAFGQTVASYRQNLASSSMTGSRYVVGYLDAQTSLYSIASVALPLIAPYFFGLLVALVCAMLMMRAIARRISKPLAQMARLADAINQNALPQKVILPTRRQDEIGEIAEVLNSVVASMHRMKSQLGVDKQLLELQVDSKNKKLSEAELKVAQTRASMKRVAYYDPVTSLPNRRLLFEQLTVLMHVAAREQKRLGLLIINLEGLRRIADTTNRGTAHALLREVTNRVIDTVRASDVVSRDEQPLDVSRVADDALCIVLHGIDSTDDALIAAERIKHKLSKPFYYDGENYPLEFYLGLAIGPEHGKEPDALIRAAEVSVNQAKEQKANDTALYDPAMDEAIAERWQLEKDLRNARMDQEFSLHYQPQVDTETGTVTGLEALIRWQHPTKGMVPPFKFIPIAEDTGLIIEIGKWVLYQACKDFSALRQSNHAPKKISVNVSALQLTQEFIDHVRQAIHSNNVPADGLQLELTESLLVQDIELVLEKLNILRHDVGVRLSVDDFGTGYSSLSYLSRFPLNELKIDRSFVVAMEHDDNALKLTGAIMAMARELNLDIVIEGVDNVAQVDRLKPYGGHVIQGFLFSKPLPMDELITYLEAGQFLSPLTESKRT